jgi:predicted enzyme related to lactoylglutathione lyase
MNGSFVVQVPNFEETFARALANGGTEVRRMQNASEGGAPALSATFRDPSGNEIEVIQLGLPRTN